MADRKKIENIYFGIIYIYSENNLFLPSVDEEMDVSQSFSEQTPLTGPNITYDGKDTFETNSKSTAHLSTKCNIVNPLIPRRQCM